MAKYIHSMIRVLDEAASVDFYDRCFGLKVAERLDFDRVHETLYQEDPTLVLRRPAWS